MLIAAVSFGLSAGDGDAGRRVLVLLLTAVWGLRLGTHIYLRNRGQGKDKRYASLLRRNRGSLAAFVLRYIYWAQGRVMWFVSLPVQVAMYERASFGLIHRIVPDGQALPAALEYGADLAADCSPASIKTMKAQLRAAAGKDVLTSIANGLELERQALASDDFAEGVRSFVERRPPRFPAPH